jgi:hypothetical protein
MSASQEELKHDTYWPRGPRIAWLLRAGYRRSHAKWPLTMADALVTNSCQCGVLRELHSDHGCNFKSRLMHELLECLGIGQVRPGPPPCTHNWMAWWSIMWRWWRSFWGRWYDAPEGLGWEVTNLPTEHRSTRPRAWHLLTWCLGGNFALWPIVRRPPDKEQSTTDYAADLTEWLHYTAYQHLKVASDRMKAYYDRLANSAGFQEGDEPWR